MGEMPMLHERLDDLAAAAGGTLISGRPDTLIHGVYTDTRAPISGGLFVALRGERFDGNAFAQQAVTELGAAAVLIDRLVVRQNSNEGLKGVKQPATGLFHTFQLNSVGPLEAARSFFHGAGVILVNDSRAGYLGIAAQHRMKLNHVLWFGITGSVGKSTTKEMLAHILEFGAGWSVHRARRSFNNAVGLPHTILGATRDHQAAVLELGTNHPGEIRQLSIVARPQIAVITGAAESHLEAFETVENVAREKSALLEFQYSRDIAVLNADDPNFEVFRRAAPGRVVTFGTKPDADVSIRHFRVCDGHARFLIRHGDEIGECRLRIPGAHQAMNAAAAIAAACAAGRPLPACVRAINSFQGVARRFAIQTLHGITIIDDAYNANPASFRSALATLKSMSAMRKFVVAGDMLELGPESPVFHRMLGRQIAETGVNALITVGPQAAIAGEAAVDFGMKPPQWMDFHLPETAATALARMLEPGDVVLVKGSHGVHLERCIERLMSDLRLVNQPVKEPELSASRVSA